MWENLEKDYARLKSPERVAEKYGVHKKVVIGHLKAKGIIEKRSISDEEVKIAYGLFRDVDATAYELRTLPSTIRSILKRLPFKKEGKREERDRKIRRYLYHTIPRIIPGAVYMQKDNDSIQSPIDAYQYPTKKAIGVRVDWAEKKNRTYFNFKINGAKERHTDILFIGFDHEGQPRKAYLIPTEEIRADNMIRISIENPTEKYERHSFPIDKMGPLL